jgi:hypothetical protein
MAKELGLSQTAIDRICHSFGLQASRKFKLSTDPQFVAKVRNIVGLYLNPPVNAIVLNVDEKSQIQALDHTQPKSGGKTICGNRTAKASAGCLTSVAHLESELTSYLDNRNKTLEPFIWSALAELILKPNF